MFFNVQLWEGEKEKKWREGGKDTSPLNPLEVTSARGGGVGTIEGGAPGMHPLLCLHLCELEAAVRSQDTDACYLETGSFLPTLVPTCCVQAAPGTPAQLPATWLELGGWVTATVLRAEIGPD